MNLETSTFPKERKKEKKILNKLNQDLSSLVRSVTEKGH